MTSDLGFFFWGSVSFAPVQGFRVEGFRVQG